MLGKVRKIECISNLTQEKKCIGLTENMIDINIHFKPTTINRLVIKVWV
jgi:hypothetical protein